jgi:hypothetical protein
MPGYQSISVIAAALQTDEETLLGFRDKGWVAGVERNNTVFFSSDQRYRAKYILYLLQTRHLSQDQIQLVLSAQRPPYSAKDVDQILNSATPLSPSPRDV